jgi:hypothetical protein
VNHIVKVAVKKLSEKLVWNAVFWCISPKKLQLSSKGFVFARVADPDSDPMDPR